MPELIHFRLFSIMKALGIFLVVIAHSALYTSLFTFTYLFNIVIFLFVAGYFFNDNSLQKPLDFFKKKFIRLYVPWVLYGVIFVLLHNFFLKIHFLSYNYNTKTVIDPYSFTEIINKILQVLMFYKWKEPLLAPLWFLLGLFSGLSVFFTVSYAAKKLSKKRFELIRFVLIVLFMIIGFIGPEINARFALFYRAFIISGLIYLGKFYSIYQEKIKLSLPIAIFCLLGLCIATYFNIYINVGGMNFGNEFLFILICCADCYLVLTFANFIHINHNGFANFLDFVGKSTFSIMALHYLAFKLVSLIQIAIYDYPINYLAYYPVIPYKTGYWWVAYTIVGIIVPMIGSFFYDKIAELIKNKFSNTKEIGKVLIK